MNDAASKIASKRSNETGLGELPGAGLSQPVGFPDDVWNSYLPNQGYLKYEAVIRHFWLRAMLEARNVCKVGCCSKVVAIMKFLPQQAIRKHDLFTRARLPIPDEETGDELRYNVNCSH
jgi:hypothetical protein